MTTCAQSCNACYTLLHTFALAYADHVTETQMTAHCDTSHVCTLVHCCSAVHAFASMYVQCKCGVSHCKNSSSGISQQEQIYSQPPTLSKSFTMSTLEMASACSKAVWPAPLKCQHALDVLAESCEDLMPMGIACKRMAVCTANSL